MSKQLKTPGQFKDVLIFLLLQLLLCSPGFGQVYATVQFSIEDGLAGNTIYDILQDSLGYLWFGTNHGLSRFDGVRFRNYNTPGLSNDDILHMEIMEGRLYFLTLNQKLFYIKNDTIYPADQEIFTTPVQDFIADPKAHLIWFFSGCKLYNYNYTTNVKKSFPLKSHKCSSTYISPEMLTQSVDGNIWIGANDSLYKVDHSTGPQFQVQSKIPRMAFIKGMEAEKRKFPYFFNNLPDTIFHFDGQEIKPLIVLPAEKRGINSILSVDGKWWIARKGSTLIYDQQNPEAQPDVCLPEKQINKFFQDASGNIWLGSNNDGVFLIKNTKISNYTASSTALPSDEIKFLVAGEDNSIWIGLSAGWVALLKDGKIIPYQIPDFNGEFYDLDYKSGKVYIVADKVHILSEQQFTSYPTDAIKSLCIDDNNILWMGSFSLVWKWDINRATAELLIQYFRSYAINTLGNEVWLGSVKGLFVINKNNDRKYHKKTLSSPEKTAIVNNPYKSLYLNHVDKIINIHSVDMNSRGYFSSEQPLFERYYDAKGDSINSDINQIAFTSDSTIWLSTNNSGLFYIQQDNIYSFNENDGLVSNNCNDLFIDQDDNIWVATTNGLNKIQYPSLDNTTFTTDDGILSNWVTSVVRTPDSMLYIGTNKGLSVVHENDLKVSTNEIPVHISKVKINEKDTTLLSSYKLPYYKNNILVEFKGISFNSKLKYSYRINDENRTTIEHNSISLPELAPGKYTIEAEALAMNGASSKQPVRLLVHIKPPWWQSCWFRFLLFCAVGGFIYYRIRKIQTTAKEKTKINKRFAELELQALQAQMNPHFVFNALGAIQSFILNNDNDSANHYLTSFAKLMRLFLDSSREKYIRLDDEITLLELYLKLEKLRFCGQFDYTIRTEEQLGLNIVEIPSMMIQPFVENAINHGLRYKKSGGLISIEFQRKANKLHCTITDNGIGREAAAKRKQKSINSYKSRGTQIVNERLKTLNYIEETEIKIQTTDKLDQNQKVCGTIVTIVIPLI